MFCQFCGAINDDEIEYCRRCHQKLLVVSGPVSLEDQEAFDSNPEEQVSLDEHMLERISILEEVVKRTTDTLRQTLGALYKLEQKILVNQTGITTLRDLLESKRVLGREEWSELWESRMDHQLLALEKRERFAAVKDQIVALYRGERRDEFRRRLEDAEYHLLAFDIDAAVQAMERAHELDPANHELSFFLGEIFFNEEESVGALRYFARVLVVKPNHFESLVYSGVLCHEQGSSHRAEDLLKRAVAQYPEAFLPTFSLGAIYASQGRLPQAVAFLERAAAVDPIPQAFFLLGSCTYEMGKVSAAIRHLREAVRLDPSFEEAQSLLGLAYLDRRWYRKALAAFRDAQHLRSSHLSYREMLLFLTGRDSVALAVQGEAGDCLRQGELALAQGRGREAISAYRRALSHDAENPTLLLAYALACLELGRVQEVESVIEKVLGLDPGERLEASAYATLIEALRSEGKYREGNRIGRLLLREDSSDFARTVAYFEMACNLAEMEEDLDSALRFAERSVELAPDGLKRFPLAALGWVCYKRREFGRSVETLARSNDLGSSAQTLTHLGMALLASGERERARRVLVEARGVHQGQGALQEKVLEALKDSARLLLDTPAPMEG